MRVALLLGAVLVALSACEQPQTATARKSDVEPWQSAGTAFTAAGWKGGDRTAWEEQMRTRAQSQNDYAKTK